MNNTGMKNETILFETETACEALAAPMSENDMPALAANLEVSPAAAPEAALETGADPATCACVTEPEAAAVCAAAADTAEPNAEALAEAGPDSLPDRALSLFFAVWDGFLDLLIALHILEESLPEEADQEPSARSASAPASGTGMLPCDRIEEAERPSIGVSLSPVSPAGCAA